MKKLLLLSILIFSFYTGKSQCSAVYGIITQGTYPMYYISVVSVDHYTGSYFILDTIPGMRDIVVPTQTIEPDSDRYVTLGKDTAHQRIYTINLKNGRVLYNPVCDSLITDVHYDVIRKKIYALMSVSIGTIHRHFLVALNPYNGSVNVLDSIAGMRQLVEETSTLGLDSARYYVEGEDSAYNPWLYTLDEATGHLKYRKHDTLALYQRHYDTVSKKIYGLYDTGFGTPTWFFGSINPMTVTITPINTIPILNSPIAFTSAFEQDSLRYFFCGIGSVTGVQQFCTINPATGNVLWKPKFDTLTMTFTGTEYDTSCFSPTAISRVDDKPNSLIIYPNPSNGVFTLQINNEELKIKNLEVYNVLGEKVYSNNQLLITNYSLLINLSSQPSGVYLYRVISTTGELIGEGKMVIEK